MCLFQSSFNCYTVLSSHRTNVVIQHDANTAIAIVGFMGCGKTAVAKILAAELKREMVDLDQRITNLQGRTPAALISEEGEQSFRSIETQTLDELLQSGFEGVISLGGGCWRQATNRALSA